MHDSWEMKRKKMPHEMELDNSQKDFRKRANLKEARKCKSVPQKFSNPTLSYQKYIQRLCIYIHFVTMSPCTKVHNVPANVDPSEPQKKSQGHPKKAKNVSADVATQDASAMKRKCS